MSPTVVLIHGAFADASGWGGVISRLTAAGHAVHAPANPLRSVSGDAAYIRSFVSTIEGPVVLVGHSYGGAVITNAAVGADNVKALVYIAAFALEEGEAAGPATALGSDGPPPDLTQVIVVRPFPDAGEGNADAYLDPAIFPQTFCQDLPAEEGAIMAVSQRPAALATLGEPSGPPAWRTLPSWYLVASQDRVIPPAAERAMAARAGSTTVEIDSSHVAMISHPDEVADLIKQAIASVG
ncbi:alpha/beta fold hydrolase [Cellulomonas sp. Leaf334]|uniref:alpha/beta fold hydrolase n=1 Tax=Cellulomonas sp. Leaf334 TaxID=1736339 RepID=UPI0006F7ECAD|nr:alpha/beta hydrolase [Cellulomonas sp. Leaf334]KQR17460.1 alpha/beta hydrolase [Cellulomonas sp. Leaf334]